SPAAAAVSPVGGLVQCGKGPVLSSKDNAGRGSLSLGSANNGGPNSSSSPRLPLPRQTSSLIATPPLHGVAPRHRADGSFAHTSSSSCSLRLNARSISST